MLCYFHIANHEQFLNIKCIVSIKIFPLSQTLLELDCVNEVPNKVHTLHLADTSFKSLLIDRFPHPPSFFLTNLAIYFCVPYKILHFLDFAVVSPPLSFRICL